MNVINTQNIYTRTLDGIQSKDFEFEQVTLDDLFKQINQLTKAA